MVPSQCMLYISIGDVHTIGFYLSLAKILVIFSDFINYAMFSHISLLLFPPCMLSGNRVYDEDCL